MPEDLAGAEDAILDRADGELGDAGDLVVPAMLPVSEQDELPVVRGKAADRGFHAPVQLAQPQHLVGGRVVPGQVAVRVAPRGRA